MRVINRSRTPVAFRDDNGKHILKQYESVEVRGDQHLVHILSLAGISPTSGPRHHSTPERPAASAVEAVDPFNDDFSEGDDE